MGITRPETLVQEALAPEKMAEAQHTAMGTRTRSPCPALALQNAPQTDAVHEDRARAFQKEKTSCQRGQTDEGSRTPMPEASHDLHPAAQLLLRGLGGSS
jgi:hypothetical protein